MIFGNIPENNSNSKSIKPSTNDGHRIIEACSNLPRPVQDVIQIFQGEIKKELSVENGNKNDRG